MSTQTVKQQIPAGTYAVDPVHSTISFAVVHNGVATFRSGFGYYEATLTGGDAPRLEGTVEVASIDIDEEQLKGHLLSPEFFDAERHPRLQLRARASWRSPTTARCGCAASSRSAARAARSRRAAASPSSAPTSPATPASASRSRQASTGAASGSTGTPSCPSGGEALEYEVEIAVELELVEEAE